jgi:hypothetical protein
VREKQRRMKERGQERRRERESVRVKSVENLFSSFLIIQK